MKKIFTLLLCSLLVSALLPVAAQQQTTVTGTDNFTANTYGPMVTNTGVRSNRHAYIYTREALFGLPPVATLTSLAFNRVGTSTSAVPAGATFKIYLKNVTQDDWGTGNLDWATAITGATLVYDSDPSSIIGTTTGWKDFALSPTFNYTGDNLAVLVEYIQPAGPATSINWVYQSSGGQPAYASNQTKYISTTTTTPGASLTSSEERHPDIRITYTSACQAPQTITGTSNGTNSATFNWTAPAGGDPVQQYEYELRTSGTPGSGSTGLVSTGTTTNTTVTISSLATYKQYAFYIKTNCTSAIPSGYAGPVYVSTIPNDECSSAVMLTPSSGITCATPAPGTTMGATASTEAAPTCSATGTNDDVWYSFVAINTTHFISLLNTTSTAAAAVYSGTCGALTQVAGACASTNATATGLTVGQTYYVRVYTTSTTATTGTDFNICVSSPIANDECDNAIALAVSNSPTCATSVEGTTNNSSQSSAAAPTCSGTGTNDDVWFKFVATSTKHVITLDNETNTTAAAIYSGTCASPTQVTCGSDVVPVTGLTVGNTYYVRVYSTSTSATTRTTFDICVVTPPANDDCTGAVSLTASSTSTCTSTVSGSTEAATQSADAAPSCSATGINDDVWYSFVATSTNHTVRLLNGSTTMAAAIYSGSCGSLTAVGCASTTAQVSGLTVGATYYVRVYSTSATITTTGTFDICVISPPANDECTNAIALPMSSTAFSCSSTISGTTYGSTQSADPAPTCNATGINDDVWYSFTATASSHVVTLSTTSVGAVIYSGSCGSLAQLADACGAGSAVATGLVIGNTYFVRVYTTSATATTYLDFNICVRPVATNDECTGAVTLTASSTNNCTASVIGTTAGATTSADAAPSCSATGINDDVWYSFQATSTKHTVIVTETFGTAAAAIYSGTCGALTQVTGACGSGYAQASGLTVGATYYVRVYTTSSTVGSYSDFSICVISAPANDDCSGAVSLTVSSSNSCSSPVAGSTAGATASTDVAPSCSATGINDDVWYSFVATATSHTISLAGTTSTSAVAVYGGSCGSLTEVTGGCASSALIVNGLTVGTTYFVRVYTTTSTATTFSPFTICIGTLPTNDECNNAISLTASTNDNCNAVAGSTIGATESANTAPTCSPTGINDDVWYSFVATTANTVVSVLEATSTTAIAVYSGPCASLTELTAGCASGRVSLTGLTLGNTYYVRVYSTSATSTTYSTFKICIAAPPVNDECANAITLSGSMNGSNITANESQAPDVCGTAISTNAFDVWYKFTAASNGDATVSITNLSSQLDGVLQGYSGSCGALTPIACADGPAEGGSETMTMNNLVAGNTYYVRVYGFNTVNFGTFTITLSGTVLPVSITSFTGERAGSVNKLVWTTATELNNAGFELQRSADGRNFSALSFINSQAMSGNSSTKLTYAFTDAKPFASAAYYRLKQVDKDGKTTVSPIVLIKGAKTGVLTLGALYPNPVSITLNLALSAPAAAKINLVVTDLAGKLVLQQPASVVAGDNKLSLQVDNLAPGNYFIKAVCGNNCETAITKFMKY
jgi:large repetitive protein